MTPPLTILGWDIGGVNTKAARVGRGPGEPVSRSVCLPYDLQHAPESLGSTLESVARSLEAGPADRHAVTMTAELSQAFRTKREGVGFILDALESVFPSERLHVYTVNGRFVSPPDARARTQEVAASNWAATAHWLARSVPTCILIDIGTTSTDLIPIVDGTVAARGRTDPERLLTGELVYTGALRTPVEAVTQRVPLWGGSAGVSADGFAIIGDAHLWLGRLSPEAYTCRTPDGRPPTRAYAGERLARTVCGDRDMLQEADIDEIARALAGAQVRTILQALQGILGRWPTISAAVVTGLGDFIAVEAARAAGLRVVSLADRLGEAARVAPAVAVASLLRQSLEPD
jgi:(4-(4-[2-(gamma-L-glutamylamino)ethyl]phenoxymethyl)furan-2-yl)methanamine synthase